MTPEKPKQRRQKRKPRKISQDYLRNAGLYYLERFSSSTANFRRVMRRKIKKSCLEHQDQNEEDCWQLLESVIQRFTQSGLLNDNTYAEAQIGSLRRKGKSKRFICTKMAEKGVNTDLVTRTLEHIDRNGSEQNPELIAAIKHCRKKRFGAFQGDKETDPQKALGSLARAGFSYEIAQKALNTPLEDAETLL